MLETPSPHDKAAMTDEIHALWAKGAIVVTYDPDAPHVPPAATTVDDRLAYERKGHVCIRDVLTDDEARNMSIELVKVILFL